MSKTSPSAPDLSATPRTDVEARPCAEPGYQDAGCVCVSADLARQLERELAEVRHDMERGMVNHIADLAHDYTQGDHESDDGYAARLVNRARELERALKIANDNLATSADIVQQYQRELAEQTEAADASAKLVDDMQRRFAKARKPTSALYKNERR